MSLTVDGVVCVGVGVVPVGEGLEAGVLTVGEGLEAGAGVVGVGVSLGVAFEKHPGRIVIIRIRTGNSSVIFLIIGPPSF
jgi:hypothetical protein